MWNLFKIINFIWLLTSTNAWFCSTLPFTAMLFLANAAMMICMSFLPFQIKIDRVVGRAMLAILGIVVWTSIVEGFVMGLIMLMSYLPAVMLTILPIDYQKDLLRFITKWLALMVGIGFIEYLFALVADPPSIGMFVHPNYQPFINYGFYIKNTYDFGTFQRFNAFFLEPGHLAMLSSFLIIANAFKFKKNPYCIILLVAVIFSFSLAGYLLLFTGWGLFWIKTMKRAIFTGIALTAAITFVVSWNMGDNAVNELIISRLEYDEEKGIKGNNRFTNETDFVYQKGQKKGWNWVGMKEHANLELIDGAGFKIFVLKNGWIGVIFALLFYLSVIPPACNIRYTSIFVAVIVLCFTQRAYPYTYTWLFPYILGIYTSRNLPGLDDMEDEEDTGEDPAEESLNTSKLLS